jgi:hypothetical protein
MESKQTAVEWLVPKILELNLQLSLRKISARNCELEIAKLFEQAQAMHEQQIIDAHVAGFTSIESAQYYTETYNQSKP